MLAELVPMIQEAMREPRGSYAKGISAVVSVGGAASLGKTFLSKAIDAYLWERDVSAIRVPLDSFVLDKQEREDRGLRGFETSGNRMPEMVATLREVIEEGRSLTVSRYFQGVGSHIGRRPIGPAPVIILDGVMNYSESVFPRFANFCVALRTDKHTWNLLRKRTAQKDRGESPKQARRFAGDWERYEELQAQFFTRAQACVQVSRDRSWRLAPKAGG